MPNKFRIPFQLQTIPALVLKSFINENVEKIVTHRTIWRVFDSGTILCLSFRQSTVIQTDIKDSILKKDLLAHIPRTCFHAAGDESWLTWISIKLSKHRDKTILTVTFCSNLLSLYRYRYICLHKKVSARSSKWQTFYTVLPVFISSSPSVSLIPYGWRSGSFNPRFVEVQLKLPPIVGQWWSNDFFSTIYITSVNKKKKTAPFTTLGNSYKQQIILATFIQPDCFSDPALIN